MRAVQPLIDLIKERHPQAQIALSTSTQTGLDEAKRAQPGALSFILPHDFPWNSKRLADLLRPSLFILVETDFWLNLLSTLKKKGCHLALVNGKMSERSGRRHRLFPQFGRTLLSHFDLISLQSPSYLPLFEKIYKGPMEVLGNLKCDRESPRLSAEQIAEKKLSLGLTKQVLTIGSTHEGEEALLLSELKDLEDYQIILVPRHPHRFAGVEQLLSQMGLSYGLYSRGERAGQVLLVDVVGDLNTLYQLADVAIVGGSFTPHVGGHNIFEPMEFGVPTLFGPYMHKQADLKQAALESEAAIQIAASKMGRTLAQREVLKEVGARGRILLENSKGATQRTYEHLLPFLKSADG